MSTIPRDQSFALLVSDVLAFTPLEELTEQRRGLLVAALRRLARGTVTQRDEEEWFVRFLDAGLNVTPWSGCEHRGA